MRDAFRLRKKFLSFVCFRFDIEHIDDYLIESESQIAGGRNTTYHSRVTIMKQLQSSSFKGFVLDNDLTFSMYNYKKKPKDRLYFHQRDYGGFSNNVYIMLPSKNHFLYSTLDWKIKQLVEGGFFVHWFDRYLSDSSLQKPEPEPDGDKVVLTMDHLSVGFIIWLGMLLIASAAFIAEIARVHLANYLRGILFRMIWRKHQRLRQNH